jgi:uncharacterized coiled-coil protein SlyX
MGDTVSLQELHDRLTALETREAAMVQIINNNTTAVTELKDSVESIESRMVISRGKKK